MLAAHLLDPINWECQQNGSIVPRFDELTNNEYDQLDKFAAAFGSTFSDELAIFKGMGIEARDVKSIKCMIAPKSDGRVPCSEVRCRTWKILLSKAYPELAKLAVKVMSMPVTALCMSRTCTLQYTVLADLVHMLSLALTSP